MAYDRFTRGTPLALAAPARFVIEPIAKIGFEAYVPRVALALISLGWVLSGPQATRP